MTISISSLEVISEAIRINRKNAGISQSELAKICGLSQSTVARIETDIGRLNPSYQTVYKIVETLSNSREFRGKRASRKAYQMMHKKIIYAKPNNTISEVIEMFKSYDFPQLPVFDSGKHVIGTVYQKDLLNIAVQNPEAAKSRLVSSIMKGALPQVNKETDLARLRPILEDSGAAIIVEGGRAMGIVTIYDVLKEV